MRIRGPISIVKHDVPHAGQTSSLSFCISTVYSF